jgi:spermidine synthase
VVGVLLLLFAGSGCSALIYEIVWLQLLQLVIGSSAVSLGVLLGTYMGGMCLGSLLLPRLVARRRHPLRVYAVLELAIGALGLAVLFGMPYVDRLYAEFGGQGFSGGVARAVVCAICLLAPTALMGATLPAIARTVDETPRGMSRLGFLYGANIAGAVLGCLLAGFYLLRVHDMAVATYAAAVINGLAGLTALLVAAHMPYAEPRATAPRPRPRKPETGNASGGASASGASGGAAVAYVVIALSGLCALGAEVVWTRVLSLLLGPTVYTFSIILAVFLFGLAVGGSVGGFLARRVSRPRAALGWCQLLLAAAIAWAAYAVARSLPHWTIHVDSVRSPWPGFGRDLLRCLWAVGPPTCLWGASFPLALAAAAASSTAAGSRGRDPGRVAGGVLGANTVGAIVGAIGFSTLVIPAAGTQGAQRLLVVLSAAAGLLSFAPDLRRPGGKTTTRPPPPRSTLARVGTVALFAVSILVAGLLARNVPKVPDLLVAFGPRVPAEPHLGDGLPFLYVGEGMNASVAVTGVEGGVRNFHVSGKVEASSEVQDMRLQRMLGHLPALLHPRPRTVLVVGCGAGVTAGSFVVHPEVERIVICEIEPLIPREVAPRFNTENHAVLQDPRVEVVYDDARHYVLTTRETFDVITSDPIHPWVKGSAALYSKEYFELCRRRLNPGGVVSQWVPLYESNREVVRSELATFFDVFPDGTIWGNDVAREGYDVVLLGQAGVMRIDVEAVQRRLSRRDHWAVAHSLDNVGFGSVVDLLGTYAGRGRELRPWLSGAQINHDLDLRLQYLAGMALLNDDAAAIYNEILSHRTFPEDLFVASELYREAIRHWMRETGPAGTAD